ncbi:flagellar hook-associated protein 3 [Clostridium novyi A str. BKT29909]|uniref:flagellar hook-associated protein FlgL n=1 Tax=Clostridium novyi TaxID=1542 RepID=UPI0004D40D2E|nr:flagellar hook-associated protein FlgL [Clostridium novyi]KEH89018.1 flagellar hook-associated protein 3 [Clostridium novyi A str. BKT29909]
MRVTNKMLSNNFLADMRTNLENINQIQQQNTSGKKFRKPSDDPFAVARSMQLHTDINTNKQYGKNITDTSNWLDTTDTALGQVGDVLQRVRELIVSAGNAAYGSDERRAIKDEINEKVGEISQILNTSFGGVYIFGGNRGTTKPVNVVGGQNLLGAASSEKIDLSAITDKAGKLNKTIEIYFNGKKEISIDSNDGEIKSLNNLAEKINNKIEGNLNFKGKIKAVPNIVDNKIMFVNTDATDKKEIVVKGTIGKDEFIKENKAEYKESKDTNTRLIYNKKDGGELEESDNEYNQIKGKLKVQVSQGVNMDYNVSATEVLQFKNEKSEEKDLRKILNNIVNHLDGKNSDGTEVDEKAVKELLNDDLKDITDSMSNLLKIRAEVGAKQNRMEGADERNKDGTFNMTEILSKHEDVDYTQNMMDYATMLSVYMASLQTSAKIIQPSLMDYLR